MRTATCRVDSSEEWRSPPGPARVQHSDPTTLRGRRSFPGTADNKLLAHLPPEVFARLALYLQPVRLEGQQVLFRAQEPLKFVYFPDTAVVSLVSRLESGQASAVGLVGSDGVVGTALFPGVTTMTCDGVVLVPGSAQRITADVLRRELLAYETLHSAIGHYLQLLLVRSMQMSVCNMFHNVEQRCSRWLLAVHDLIGHQDIPLTHDVLATMLGARRPTVTLVIGSLHRAGLIGDGRGRISIRDRRRLEAASCECYRVMRDEQQRLLGY
jgi:CRP-like cAMP-binding protein